MSESMVDNLEHMLKQVGGLVNVTIDEQEIVNKQGANVLKESLVLATREKHYQPNRSTEKIAHLADSIVIGKLEGTDSKNDGSAAVGYRTDDVNHARIARFLNDGTKYMPGDSYHDRAISEAVHGAVKLQAKALGEIQKKKVNRA